MRNCYVQQFDESFHEAWDRYKELLRACPHHSFTKLHQLDTFYNALNPADRDSLNSVTGCNLMERRTQDVLTIIENKSKVRNSRNKLIVSQVKSSDANSSSSSEIAKLTHAVNQQTSACLATDGNTFPELRDNIQGYVSVAVVNYNQGNSGYRPPVNQRTSVVTTAMIAILKQFQATPPLASVKAVEEICVTCGGAHSYYQCLAADGNTFNNLGIIFKYTLQQPQLITIRLGLPELISTRMTLELANREICTTARIARNVFISVGKFTFPSDFFIVDYESDPRVLLILGRPFLRTDHGLIDVHGKEMILHDGDERLTLNIRHDTSSYSNQPQKESINLINVFNDSSEVFLENLFSTNHQSGNPTFSSHLILTLPKVKDDIFDPEGGNVLPKKLLDLDSTKDLHLPHHVNPLSGSTTTSSSPTYLLEEFADELTLITFPPEYDDDLSSDIDYNLKEIEYLLHHDPIKNIDSILKDSIDQSNLTNLNDNLVDSMPEMFTNEHALDYSSPSLYDEYDDDLFKVESDTKNVYDNPFDSKREKIKEFKLLIDELDLPCDFLLSSEYDSFLSKDFSEVDTLPSTNNEDKVFNPGILIKKNLFKIITRVAQDKKLAISHASLMQENFDPPLYELLFFKEVPRSKILLSLSSENERKVFKPGIHTFKKVHSSPITELSHQGYKVFKINQILKNFMKNFLFSCGENIYILDVLYLYFYPLDQL
nr:reverse transcriptase domain-containing protein [Tanacetum cinerariifolium]